MASEICAAFKAPFWSCLLANTSRMESLSSSSCVSTTAPKSQFRPREHREEGAQPAYLQHGVQLLLGDVQSIDIGRVHDVDQRVRVGVVAPPVGADAGLPAQVPDLELDVLVLQRLHIEADGGHSLLDFIGLQTVCQRPHAHAAESAFLFRFSPRPHARKQSARLRPIERATYTGWWSCRRCPDPGSGCAPPCSRRATRRPWTRGSPCCCCSLSPRYVGFCAQINSATGGSERLGLARTTHDRPNRIVERSTLSCTAFYGTFGGALAPVFRAEETILPSPMFFVVRRKPKVVGQRWGSL